MRTPLNTIQIGVELLKSNASSSNTSRYCFDTITDMHNSCKVAEWTLDNLLTYKALLSNSLVLNIKNVNIWEYLNRVLGDMPVKVHI